MGLFTLALSQQQFGPIKRLLERLVEAHTRTTESLDKVAEALSALQTPPGPPPASWSFEGGGFMRIYVGDRPAENVRFTKPKVVDSEGTPVHPQPELNYSFSTSNADVVAVTDNGDGTIGVVYGTPHQLEDGSYEIVDVRAESNTIETPAGSIKDVKAEQIQLLPGNAAGFAGGGLEFQD